jgi:hypothetical protein
LFVKEKIRLRKLGTKGVNWTDTITQGRWSSVQPRHTKRFSKVALKVTLGVVALISAPG